MAEYTISIRKDGLFSWWWHVLGSRKYGHALTEQRAKKAVARAIKSLEETPPCSPRFQNVDSAWADEVLSE